MYPSHSLVAKKSHRSIQRNGHKHVRVHVGRNVLQLAEPFDVNMQILEWFKSFGLQHHVYVEKFIHQEVNVGHLVETMQIESIS